MLFVSLAMVGKYRMVQKKLHRSLIHHHSATACNRIMLFHQNAQERSLATSRCKICNSWL